MNAFILVNTASGSCTEGDEEEIRSCAEKNGVLVVGSWSGTKLQDAFSEIHRTFPETLIVLGGDGTIRSAIENCKKSVKNFIFLPGGTMNLLSRAVYGDFHWKKILEKTLAGRNEKIVSSGKIGDKEFYVAALFGTPSIFARVREALRAGNFTEVITHGFSALTTPFMSFSYESYTDEGGTETLLITTPLVSDILHNDAKALEVAAISVPGAFETLRMLSAAALGVWRHDQNVSTHAARKIRIRAQEPIPATLDGEPTELPYEVEVEFVADAVRVLAP